MRKIAFIIAAFMGLVVFCQAMSREAKTNGKPIISVSILPQKYFVEQIAGNYFQVNVILPPGSGPEEFEPTPQQIQNVSNSKFYFYIGHLGFEKSWVKKVAEVSHTVKFVSCSKGLDLLEEESTHAGEKQSDNNDRGTDPHIWTSPENVKTISKTICTELSLAFPEKKSEFEKNLYLFVSKIDSLDNHIRMVLSDSTKSSFMIFHPALGYFARDYHLKQYSIEFDGKTPSTAHMKRMVDTARKERINTIFIQAQFETAKAEAIAKEIRAKIVPIDNLSENWLAEMYSLADKMKDALTIKPNEKPN
jgi:zinc transport system substrate-binding protein